MEPTLCPSCGQKTPSEYSFCEQCEKQVRCLNPECKQKLVAGKSICLYCGAAILLPTSNRGNSFQRFVEQKGEDYKEEIKIDMTDHAVSELAPFIAGQIVPRGGQRQTFGANDGNHGRTRSLPGAAPPAMDFQDGDHSDSHQDEGEVLESKTADSKFVTTYKFFEKDGEKLVLLEKDFKGSSFKEQVRRFIVLYTAEYFRNFNKPVPNADNYLQAAKKANVYNSKNFTPYFNRAAKEFLTELSEGYKLNNSGETELQTIVSEMQNAKSPAGHPYWEQKASTTTAKPIRFGKDDEAKVQKWLQDDVNLGKLQIGDLKKGLDYLLVGIWILTEHLKKEKAVRWLDAYQYLKRKFTTIKATSTAVSLALSKPNASKYIVKTDDSLYLNSDGKAVVEKWVNDGIIKR